MASKCFSSVRGKVARMTALNSVGAPVSNARGTAVTDGFITVSYSPVIRDGEEIEVTNANGALCVSDRSDPVLKWYEVEVEFCNVDPALLGMMTGNEIVTDTGANDVGLRVAETIGQGNFGLEVWSDVPGVSPKTYGYFLLPWVRQGVLQDFTLENGALSLTVAAITSRGAGWGTGPYNVVPSSTGTPAKLQTPIGSRDHLHLQTTTIAPPVAACGVTALA